MRYSVHALSLAFGVLAGASSYAAETPLYGPTPGWVKPASLPTAPPSEQDKNNPIRMLLYDNQVAVHPDGLATYTAYARKVETPLGLSAAGPVAIAWSPDTETVTIHHVRIRRGDQTLDLLRDGKGVSVLRRERNLEYRMLDGVLSATVQPDGLQVGDVVEVAFTKIESDPTLKGHAQTVAEPFSFRGAQKVNFRAVWPKDHVLRWRASDLPGEVKATPGEITLTLLDPKTFESPRGAPRRFQIGPRLELSDFASWQEVSALFYPLYKQAHTLAPDSPLKVEIEKIKTASADPVVQASAALALVEDKVRYFAVTLDRGGYLPATADETWSRRFGDCKAKTVLLLALLDGLGIKAEAAVVSSADGDGLDQRLPMAGAFDHIIVRAEIAGKVHWLDGTRIGDVSIAAVPTPDFKWALPLSAAGQSLERIEQVAPDKPMSEIVEVIDASAGVSVPANLHAETVLRGDAGRYFNMFSATQPVADREKAMKAYWTMRYPGLQTQATTAVFDAATGELRMTVDGQLFIAWLKRGETMRVAELRNATLSVGGGLDHYPVAAINPDKAEMAKPKIRHEDAPFAVNFPGYSTTSTKVLLPKTAADFTLIGANVDRTLGGRAIKRESAINDGVVTIRTSVRALTPEITLEEGKAARQTLNQIASDRVAIVAPETRFSEQNRFDEVAAKPPVTKYDYAYRAAAYAGRFLFKEALASADKAIAMGDDSWGTRATRAKILMDSDRPEEAAIELQKVLATPGVPPFALNQYQIDLARTDLKQGKFKAGLVKLDNLIDGKPNDGALLVLRGQTRWAALQEDGALTDFDAAIAAMPNNLEAYVTKALLLVEKKKAADAADTLRAMTANNPLDPDAFRRAGGVFLDMSRPVDAAVMLDKSLMLKPTATAYFVRARLRLHSDGKQAAADLEAGLALDSSLRNLILVSDMQMALGDYGGAAKSLTAAIALTDDRTLHAKRVAAYEAAGQKELAARSYATVRGGAAKDATLLNSLCWAQATANVNLPRALADCDAAIKLKRTAAIYDSRGFVLLRLGRYAEAIEAYDFALDLAPKQAASFYGRALAKMAKSESTAGKADLLAARDLSPTIDQRFADYGIKPPVVEHASQ